MARITVYLPDKLHDLLKTSASINVSSVCQQAITHALRPLPRCSTCHDHHTPKELHMSPASAFAKFEAKAWPHTFHGTMHIARIAGGTPTDPKVAEGWIKTKLGAQTEDLIRAQVAEVMVDRGVTTNEAASLVDANRHLNGFKRDEQGLYIEGRQLKAAIKEAASVAGAAGKLPLRKWGLTGKGLLGFIAEHVCVVEDRLHLGASEPSGVNQRFVSTWRGTGIQYEEYCDDVTIDFTIQSDHEFTEEQWAMIWLTGGQQGIGATRSQGYGRYTVTRWEADDSRAPARRAHAR